MSVAAATVCERDWLLGIKVTLFAFIALKLDSDYHRPSTNRHTSEVSASGSVPNQSLTSTFGTAQHFMLALRFYNTTSFLALTSDISKALQPKFMI